MVDTGFIKKYLQNLRVMEYDINHNDYCNREEWLPKVQIEIIKTEFDLAILVSEARACAAEEALKSMVEFLFRGSADEAKSKILTLVQSQNVA